MAAHSVRVTGVQLEVPSVSLVKAALDGALKKYPATDIFVLSENTFSGPPPDLILQWCEGHHKFLIAGGDWPAANSNYFNTAFVVDGHGAIAFQQGKCVPVQFMNDGLPAARQRVWNSPWGKIGLGICYDASYARVTDELIRQGAEALIFPTMDSSDWGEAEHQLHARIAPLRAAEYGVPVFRVCSSGISELAASDGRVVASAPYPGPDAILSGTMQLPSRGHLPFDRWLARVSVVVTFLILGALLCRGIIDGRAAKSWAVRS